MSRQDPVALGRRLDETLAEAERMVREVPEVEMDERVRGLDGTLRDLAFRLFRLGLTFTDGMDLGRVPAEWYHEAGPEDLRDGAAVARYGALVRGRLAGWLEGAGPGELARVIDAPDGPCSGYELLEHVTADAGRHRDTLRVALARLGRVSP
ncbi:MAG TPA: hypothetical protein VJX92_00555 [Methylomirabilota bacterium]|nr:hypothetical protein [Methylomirabilota bacterium]